MSAPAAKKPHNKSISSASAKVAVLGWTKSLTGQSEKWIVADTAVAGPTACIIDVKRADGTRYIRDAVILLPAKPAPSRRPNPPKFINAKAPDEIPFGKPFTNNVYSAALAVVETEYRKFLNESRKLCSPLAKLLLGPKSRCSNGREEVTALGNVLDSTKLTDADANELMSAYVAGHFWTPYLLAIDGIDHVRWRQRWGAIQHWDNWTATGVAPDWAKWAQQLGTVMKGNEAAEGRKLQKLCKRMGLTL